MENKTTIYLPSDGNSITEKDIANGTLRITVHAKPYFPSTNCSLEVNICGKIYETQFRKQDNRSDLLQIGREAMDVLGLKTNSILKISKIGSNQYSIEKSNFLFSPDETDNVDYFKLKELKRKYWRSLKEQAFPQPPKNGTAIEMINYFKRTKDIDNRIGPYFGITVFEAANRIASDLVIMNGILQLIEDDKEPKDSKISLRLGNKHIKGKGDFTINGKEGEAFNVASTFYKVKLRSTTQKWLDNELTYILVNGDVFNEIKGEIKDTRIVKVEKWDSE